jgi:hypothetical protein
MRGAAKAAAVEAARVVAAAGVAIIWVAATAEVEARI